MPDRPVEAFRKRWLWYVGVASVGLGLLCIFLVLVIALTGSRDELSENESAAAGVQELVKQIEAARVKGTFVLIDTARNRLYLRKGEEILLDAVCSTGSGVELTAGEKKWTFRTPRGAFRVISKTRNPVWRKPDWAFLEEGAPVPKNERDRYESGVLGEYALGICDGYFIHGTLYTRMLGTNVTHGCIRLGDEDLAFLAKKVPIGSKVYIY